MSWPLNSANLGSVLSCGRLPVWAGWFLWPEYQITVCEGRFGASQSALFSLKHKESCSSSEEDFIVVRASMSANNKLKTWPDAIPSSLLQLTLLWAGELGEMISRSHPPSPAQWVSDAASNGVEVPGETTERC